MRIISYNVNGLRSAQSKGLELWVQASQPDVFLMQEIKATPDVVDTGFFEEAGFHMYWFPAQKKGYSGVAIFSKIKPKAVIYGCNHPIYDSEGRTLILVFDNLTVMNVYMPSGTTGQERQNFKFEWLDFFFDYVQSLLPTHPNLIIGGDFNICHKPIDIHNPVANAQSSGFLPAERAWMEKFFNAGFIDTFRKFNQEPHQYTWWSYRAGARARNLGWRIDYLASAKPLEPYLQRATILKDAKHSDHCPTLLEINII